jgi:hypothetical protein
MRIEAEQAAVTAVLADLVSQIIDGGGLVHEGLCLHERGGSMWASVDMGAVADTEAPLIHVPEALLVPTDGLRWVRPDAFDLSSGHEALSPTRRRILDSMLELYRLTGKMDEAARSLVRMVLPIDSPLFLTIKRAHPAVDSQGLSRDPASALLDTRTLLYSSRADATQSVELEAAMPASSSVLMPLVELLNHHGNGAPFSTRAGGVKVKVRSIGAGAECYARYGYYDAMSLLLFYGYVDLQPRFVQSIACQLNVDGFGSLVIKRQDHRPPLDLPWIERQDGRMTVSHLNFDIESPRRAVSTLRVLAAGLHPKASAADLDRFALTAWIAVCDTNTLHYREIIGLIGSPAVSGNRVVVEDMLLQVAQHQLKLLDEVRNGVLMPM